MTLWSGHFLDLPLQSKFLPETNSFEILVYGISSFWISSEHKIPPQPLSTNPRTMLDRMQAMAEVLVGPSYLASL